MWVSKRRVDRVVHQHRERILKEWDAVAHALENPGIGLYSEALMVLALAGWDPDEFYAEVTSRGLEAL